MEKASYAKAPGASRKNRPALKRGAAISLRTPLLLYRE
jgi:hypothetical protein